MARHSGRRPAASELRVCLTAAAFAASLAPGLPIYARQLDASPPEVGLLAAAPLIVASAAPCRASGGENLDHRRLALAATALLAVAPPLCAFATAPWQLLVLRAMLGLALFPAANAAASDVLRGERQGHGAWALAGWIVGPFLAGLAAERWGLQYAFFVAGAFGVAALLLQTGTAALGSAHRAAAERPPLPEGEGWGEGTRHTSASRGTLGMLALGVVAVVLIAFLPVRTADAGLGSAHLGALIAGAAAAAGLACWSARNMSAPYRPAFAVVGILAGALACVTLALATSTEAFWAAALLYGAAGGVGACAQVQGSRDIFASPVARRMGLAGRALAVPLAGVGVLLVGEEAAFLLAGIALAATAVATAALLPAPSPQPTAIAQPGIPHSAEPFTAARRDELLAAGGNPEPVAGSPQA